MLYCILKDTQRQALKVDIKIIGKSVNPVRKPLPSLFYIFLLGTRYKGTGKIQTTVSALFAEKLFQRHVAAWTLFVIKALLVDNERFGPVPPQVIIQIPQYQV